MKEQSAVSGARRSFLYWLPAILVLGAIFAFSSQSYERQNMKKPLSRLIEDTALGDWMSGITVRFGDITIDGSVDGPASVLEFAIRKLAHITEYTLLGICLLIAIRHTTLWRLGASAGLALLLSAAYAAGDEYHQIFTEGRSPHFEDVLLDTGGALLGIAALTWIKLRTNRKANQAKVRPSAEEGL